MNKINLNLMLLNQILKLKKSKMKENFLKWLILAKLKWSVDSELIVFAKESLVLWNYFVVLVEADLEVGAEVFELLQHL